MRHVARMHARMGLVRVSRLCDAAGVRLALVL